MPALRAWKRLGARTSLAGDPSWCIYTCTQLGFCGLRPQPKILSPKETKKAERQEEDIETARKPSLFPLFSPFFVSFGYLLLFFPCGSSGFCILRSRPKRAGLGDFALFASSMERRCAPPATSSPASERLVRVQAGGRNAINSLCTPVSGVPFRRFR
jgi:hypothetical protein